MKVLVADDDRALVDLLTAACKRHGYTVTTAADGPKALARWLRDEPDLVLLNVHLPKLDGFEVCRRIRQESDTPVMLLTGCPGEADMLRGFEAGADDYLVKPLSTTLLAARMGAVLRRYA
jgi:DNA-binding response OmpR family regulator